MKQPNKQKESRKRDLLFRELATRYVEQEGKLLKEEARLPELYQTTSRMDARVYRGIRGKRVTAWVAGLSVAAACLLTLFVAPRLFENERPPEPAESIGFTMTIPSNLSLVETKQDRGQTVYHFAEAMGDDVVMVEEKAELPDSVKKMECRTIQGTPVYTKQTEDYCLVLFKKEDVLYTLTCRYEMETLLEFCQYIL